MYRIIHMVVESFISNADNCVLMNNAPNPVPPYTDICICQQCNEFKFLLKSPIGCKPTHNKNDTTTKINGAMRASLKTKIC